MGYRWKTLGDVDPKRWADLIRVISDADGHGEYYAAEDLEEELAEANTDVEADTIAVLDGDELVAWGQQYLPSAPVQGAAMVRIMGGVRPDYRGRGIGRELFARQEAAGRSRAAAVHPDLPVQLTGGSLVTVRGHIALLEHPGYRPVHYFHAMQRAVAPGDAGLPLDPRVRPYEPSLSETVRLAHITAFAGHWGSSPPSPVEWQQQRVGSRTFRREQSFVASSHDDSRVDGYVLCYQFEPDEIYIGQMGVVPSARRQGLAKALLAAAIASIAGTGAPKTALDVDSDNADGAGALYTSLGFDTIRRSAMYQLPSPE
jgi:ribosomal protein S18 acetylase RimI-like enzyme